ncbi:MAG: uroporphyrinogen decarboxylase family protein [Anaerolineae bacterium]
MFTPPSNWRTLSAQARREARFADWMATDGKPMATPEAKATYLQHTQRVKDIVDLKKPDRVPLLPFMGAFFAQYAGITPHDVMYDYVKYTSAWLKYNRDFQPDYLVFSGAFNPGKVFDLLDYKVYRWPGHGIAETQPFQTVEGEYMRADEYDAYIADPEAYYMRTYMPRAFGALGGWAMLPSVFATMELPMLPAYMIPAGLPPVMQSFQAFMDAAKAALEYAMASGQADGQIMAEMGLPALPGGFTKAPFDIVGDTMRGTRAIMLDMYRQPAKLLAAVDRTVPIAVQLGVQTATGQGNPFVFIPLHKGADGFMSNADFKKFYWPSLKATLLGLINEGLVPYLFVEGGYNSRLDTIADPDIPAGSTYWSFDKTDMQEVKKKLGGWACFAGNLPNSMLHAGTPAQVADYVKQLIDTVAVDGGYALAAGAVVDEARPENLHAMFETCKTYGVYR